MPQKKMTSTGKVRWVARWRDPAGKPRSKTFDTRREAKAHEDTMSLKRRSPAYHDPDVQRTTVSDLMTDWIRSRNLRASSVATYEHTRDKYLDWLGGYPAVEVTPADVIQWYRDLQHGHRALAPTSARNAVRHLRSAMVWGVKQGILTHNPVTVPPAASEVEPDDIPALEDIRRTIACVREGGAVRKDTRKDSETGKRVTRTYAQGPRPWIADMMELVVMTGLRISEAAGLVVSDVDTSRGVIRVRQQLSKGTVRRRTDLKTSASRRDVPIPEELWPLINRLVADAGAGGWLFTDAAGNTLVTGRVAADLKRAAEHVGAPTVHFHALRHFYASVLLTAGVPIQDVAVVMGHGNPAVTLRTYAHVIAGSQDRVAAAVSSTIGWGISGGSPRLRVVGE